MGFKVHPILVNDDKVFLPKEGLMQQLKGAKISKPYSVPSAMGKKQVFFCA